jgi:hypothetical protein
VGLTSDNLHDALDLPTLTALDNGIVLLSAQALQTCSAKGLARGEDTMRWTAPPLG